MAQLKHKHSIQKKIQQIEDSNDKYNGWMGFITAAIVTTNYTEYGWGVTRAPEHITKKLQDRLYKTLEVTKIEKRECSGSSKDNEEEEGDNEKEGECIISEQEITQPLGEGARKEHFINVIEGEDHARPIMITDGAENRDILNEMKPMFEWWSGKELQGSIAYGIRAYRNDSNLLMHVDKSSTHVISGIFHVDRSDDAEPWRELCYLFLFDLYMYIVCDASLSLALNTTFFLLQPLLLRTLKGIPIKYTWNLGIYCFTKAVRFSLCSVSIHYCSCNNFNVSRMHFISFAISPGKCFHGRPQTFIGSYYASLFM